MCSRSAAQIFFFGGRSTKYTKNHNEHKGFLYSVVPFVIRRALCAPIPNLKISYLEE